MKATVYVSKLHTIKKEKFKFIIFFGNSRTVLRRNKLRRDNRVGRAIKKKIKKIHDQNTFLYKLKVLTVKNIMAKSGMNEKNFGQLFRKKC